LLRFDEKKNKPGLVILGKASIDSDNNQVGQIAGSAHKRPQGTFALSLLSMVIALYDFREVDAWFAYGLLFTLRAYCHDGIFAFERTRYCFKLPDIEGETA